MRWTTKARLQRLMSAMPGGERLYYRFQRHLTRSLRIGEAEARVALRRSAVHVEAWQRFGTRPVGDITAFEFGAGWHLGGALCLANAGVGQQIVTDVRPLARLDLVREMYDALDVLLQPIGLDVPRPSSPLDQYLATIGVDYRAPCDARSTGLPAASIDLITSSHVMEHIPHDSLPSILEECRRIIRPDGIASLEINYQDHYSGADPKIGPFNFLRFSDEEWSRLNSDLHHQNRLRHPDYESLLADAGFELLDVSIDRRDPDIEAVRSLPLAHPFCDLPPDDLAVRMAKFVVSPRS